MAMLNCVTIRYGMPWFPALVIRSLFHPVFNFNCMVFRQFFVAIIRINKWRELSELMELLLKER